MNPDQARKILQLYRPGTADEHDPAIREALALAQNDPELARWLTAFQAGQSSLRAKFRGISVPEGLQEQIISEHAASRRHVTRRHQLLFAAAAVAFLLVVATMTMTWLHQRRPSDDTLAIFQKQMAGYALRGYAMDLLTTNGDQIRAFLKQHQSPADYILPPPLEQAARSGCSIEGWQNTRVSMICFRTGKPLPPGSQSDLWLFVVDRTAVEDIPAGSAPQISHVNRLLTATWVRDGKLYFLATEGSEQDLGRFL